VTAGRPGISPRCAPPLNRTSDAVDAKEEAACMITMFVRAEAADLAPGGLERTEGESDERHAERSALMDRLFAIPNAE